ncbi:MAG: hypothetical protein U1F98_01875 [Verrucomicrobiota bacterium]
MPTKVPRGASSGAGAGLDTRFRVVMAYDDFLSGQRALATCQFLSTRLGRGVELRSSMWKFDVLRNPGLARMAVEDASEADVIIIANAPRTGLPNEVRAWIQSWLPRKKGQFAALVALMDFTDKDNRESREAHAFLKRAAAETGIDFLSREIRSDATRLPFLRRPFLRHPGSADPSRSATLPPPEAPPQATPQNVQESSKC